MFATKGAKMKFLAGVLMKKIIDPLEHLAAFTFFPKKLTILLQMSIHRQLSAKINPTKLA
jgi:hypothetical protein